MLSVVALSEIFEKRDVKMFIMKMIIFRDPVILRQPLETESSEPITEQVTTALPWVGGNQPI